MGKHLHFQRQKIADANSTRIKQTHFSCAIADIQPLRCAGGEDGAADLLRFAQLV